MRLAVAERLADALSQSRSTSDVHDGLVRASGEMGFAYFALTLDLAHPPEPGASVLLHDYPQGWADVYVGLNLAATDPIRRAAEKSMNGFRWETVSEIIPLTQMEKRMFETGQRHGIANGFTVPRHLPGDVSGSCTFVTKSDQPLPRDMLPVAELIGAMALNVTRQLERGDVKRRRSMLTDRQRDCVLWAARGKSDWEIATILKISHETVIQHLKEARERYDTHKRGSLIICALYDGLISYSDIFRWWVQDRKF